MLSKSIFSLSYDQIYFLMKDKIPLEQLIVKIQMENTVVDEDDEQFELIILEETNYNYTFNN